MGFSFEFKRRKGGLFLLLYKYPFSSSEKVVRDFSSKNSEKSRTWVGFLVAENFRFLKTLSLKKKKKSFWGFTVWFQKNGGDRIFFLRRETFCFINSVSIAVFRRNVVAVSVCPFRRGSSCSARLPPVRCPEKVRLVPFDLLSSMSMCCDDFVWCDWFDGYASTWFKLRLKLLECRFLLWSYFYFQFSVSTWY